jgi:hypothetical protein
MKPRFVSVAQAAFKKILDAKFPPNAAIMANALVARD